MRRKCQQLFVNIASAQAFAVRARRGSTRALRCASRGACRRDADTRVTFARAERQRSREVGRGYMAHPNLAS
jgi:hypothetical protein